MNEKTLTPQEILRKLRKINENNPEETENLAEELLKKMGYDENTSKEAAERFVKK
ncbi:MAG: hypothetical protein SFT91_00380 [Rickettsiaceae bacterium]|nr:hypothetical protein [Rickettsiaceae bacterium]